MKVVVTGGSGDLGSIVLRRLAAERKVKEVVSLDLRPPLLEAGKVRSVLADVCDPALGEHLAGADAVVHLAFIVTHRAAPEVLRRVNVEGSLNVFRAAAARGVKHLVYASSVAAYGVAPGHPRPIVEETPRVHAAALPYSAAKFEVEALLDRFEPEHPDLVVTRLRPTVLVGRHMTHPLMAGLRRRVLFDLGGAPMPMVLDEDVADAVVLAIKKKMGGAFNLATDEALSGPELAALAGLRRVPLPARPVVRAARGWVALKGALGARTMDPAWLDVLDVELHPSSEKARAQLGWRPRCRTAADVARRLAAELPCCLDPRLAATFGALAVLGRLAPRMPNARGLDCRVRLSLVGRNGGDLGLELKDERLRVLAAPPRPASSLVTLTADDLLGLLAGRLDYTSALLMGRITLEGDPTGGQVIQGLAAIAARVQRDARGLAARFAPGGAA